MTPEQIDLARRLVARPEWRWRARMHLYGGGTVIDGNVVPLVDGVLRTSTDEVSCYLDPGPAARLLPDLTDDATGGVLLGMLPGSCSIDKLLGGVYAIWARKVGMGTPLCPTLAEAAARALLACWEAADADR